MKASLKQLAIAALSIVPVVFAQTPPSYSPATPYNLGVYYNEASQVFVPGYPLGTSDTQTAPVLTLPPTTKSTDYDTLYMAFMIDPDKLNPEHGNFSETLQWYQPDLRLSRNSHTLSKIAHGTNPAAVYGGPMPPAGQIHRYVVLVFKQKADYRLPEPFEHHLKPVVSARYFWNMTEFVHAAGLAEPVAANWYAVSGGKAPEARRRTHMKEWWL